MEKAVLNYRIIIERETYPDGTPVYVAYCPTLGVTDYGDTVEAVLESIQDGIELAVSSLIKQGKEVPKDDIEDQIITATKIRVPAKVKVASAV